MLRRGKRYIDFLILGSSSDKDITSIGAILCPLAKNVIFTKSHSPRATNPHYLKRELSYYCKNSASIPKLESALSVAIKSTPPDGVILITGSLFLVGDVIKKLKIKNEKL